MPEEDRSRSQELVVRTSGRSDAAPFLIALLCLRDVGLVIPVEFLEEWVIGIFQLVDRFTALRMADDSCISLDLDDVGGNERIVAHF